MKSRVEALVNQADLMTNTRRKINTQLSQEDISERVTEERKARKMTLQACAKASGVSTSALSKIERGELSPTITTLQKIAAGFEIDISDLLVTSQADQNFKGRRSVSRASEVKAPTNNHKSTTCNNFLLCQDLRDKKSTPVRTIVTARSTDEYVEWPKSDAEIFLFVLSGEMLLHSGIYEPLELGAGDSVYYDANVEHCWTSISEEDAEVLWVFTN